MAKPQNLTTKACLIQLWRNFYAYLYALVAPLLQLFHSSHSHGNGEQKVPLSEESSEPEDTDCVPVVVTSKTGTKPEEANFPTQVSDNETEEEVEMDEHTTDEFNKKLQNIIQQLKDLSPILYSLFSAVCKENNLHGIEEAIDDETSSGVRVDRAKDGDEDDVSDDKEEETPEQNTADTSQGVSDGTSQHENACEVAISAETRQAVKGSKCNNDDVDAKKDHTQLVSSTSPPEIAATSGNVAEEPPEDQETTDEVAVSADREAGQTVDESSCTDLLITPLTTEERNLASDDFTGTPDNGRPPENNDHERHGDGYIDSGPRAEMLYMDHSGTSNTTLSFTKQRDCFNADTYDPSSGPSGLFEIEENPGPLSATDGFLQDKPWDDCGGMNDEVDSGPKEMLFGLALSNTLADTGRLNYGDDDDDDNGYHGDVSSGDDQLPRDAWGLERHEDEADKGLVVSAMRHVSKPSGQDMGIVGEDTDDLKLSIEATGNEKDNSRAGFHMEPQGHLHVNNNNNNNNNSDNNDMGCTPDVDCG